MVKVGHARCLFKKNFFFFILLGANKKENTLKLFEKLKKGSLCSQVPKIIFIIPYIIDHYGGSKGRRGRGIAM